MTALAFPALRLRTRRLRTFAYSMIGSDSCTLLCSEGFFYNISTSTVACIYCGNHEEEDTADGDLLTVHLQNFPSCSSIRVTSNFRHPLRPSVNSDPVCTSFVDYSDRRNSFTDDWPLQIRQKRQDLGANGFFYTGFGDHVRCFQEGCLVKNWKVTDNISQRHLKEYPTCHFALACWIDQCVVFELLGFNWPASDCRTFV